MASQAGRRQPTLTEEPSATASKPAFVGRDDALARVRGALEHGPAIVVVEGEAGIGKTRLLGEALRGLDGRRVLVAACPALTDPFPLGGLVEGLRRFVRTSDVQLASLGLSALGGALRPLFPEWADNLPPALEALDDSKETRHRLLRALTELVERLDVDILVVEDAHWADPATLEWLLTLTAGEPAAEEWTPSIVVTYRPTDVPEGSLLLRLTSRPPAGIGQVRIELGPLDVADTRRLVGSMFGTEEVSEEFAAFLHERADGVPLAIEESVRVLRDRKDIVRMDQQWSRRALDDLEVPPTVRDSVLERVQRLHPDVRAILHAGAVLAHPSDEHLFTTVAGLDETTGPLALTAALTSGLLQETDRGRFVFRHALDAQAVGEAIPASQRRSLHSRAADVLRSIDPAPVVRLARHYREAGDAEAWCQYAEAAADLALESGDNLTAATLLDQVLSVLEHPIDRRVRLVHKLGEAGAQGLVALGEIGDRIVAALRAVLVLDDLPADASGELRLQLGRLLMQLGEFDAGYAEIEAALPALQHRPALAARAMLFLAVPVAPSWPATRHAKWLVRASRLVPQIESAAERMSCAADRAMILLMLGEEAGWQAAAELPTSAPTREEQQEIARGLLNVGQSAITWGRLAEARECLEQAADMAEAIAYLRVMPTVEVATALLDWYAGNWAALGDRVGHIAEAEDAKAMTRMEARLIQSLLAVARGARSTAQEQLRSVMQDAARRGHAEPATLLAPAALARLHVADGALDDALVVTEPAVTMLATKGVWLWGADIMPVHVDALVGAGRLDDAADLVTQFSEGVAGRNAAAPAAGLMVCQAILAEAQGQHSRAADLFAEAANAWAAVPRPYDELLALERKGLSLLAAGRQKKALELLSHVQERLVTLGAQWDADRVAHLLREHGVEVARVWRGGRRGYGDQLSPRELQVVELVARGMTNKEVADVLFVSPRTVAMQLSAAMRKLGVTSRTAVAMAAVEAGLLSQDAERGDG